MLRLSALAGIAALTALLLLLAPEADPVRSAADGIGALLHEPVATGPDWRAKVAPGDVVELSDGRHGTVAAVDFERVDLLVDGEELVEGREHLAALLAARPLWKELAFGPGVQRSDDGGHVLQLAGSRMLVLGELQEDLVLHRHVLLAVLSELRAIVAAEGLDLEVREAKKTGAFGPSVVGVLGEGKLQLDVQYNPREFGTKRRVHAIVPWRPPVHEALLGPLVAVFLALLLRRPVVALLVGALTGAVAARYYAGAGLEASFRDGGLDLVRHAQEFFGSLRRVGLLMMVASVVLAARVVGRAGWFAGKQGKQKGGKPRAPKPRLAQTAAGMAALAGGFDPNVGPLAAGALLRPFTDRAKVAREKLAWIVDLAAAPLAGVLLLSVWGSLYGASLAPHLPAAGWSPGEVMAVFTATLPYRYYTWAVLALGLLLMLSGRDFGPMLQAERRARGGAVMRPRAHPLGWGRDGDGSRLAMLVAVGAPLLLLFLTWSMASTCRDMGAAAWVASALRETIGVEALPFVLLGLAAAIALVTGSSLLALGLLLPPAIDMAYQLGQLTAQGGQAMVVLAVTALLEGAVFGAHVSPLANSTVLASTGAGADHMDHVGTQAPYAVTALLIALLGGFVPVALFGLPYWVGLAIAGVAVLFVTWRVGRKVSDPQVDRLRELAQAKENAKGRMGPVVTEKAA